MALKKCPRCELNYILDGSPLCVVCKEEVHGRKHDDDDAGLCTVCAEAPALPGKDMCGACLREFRAFDLTNTDNDNGDDHVDTKEIDHETISEMDEFSDEDDVSADDGALLDGEDASPDEENDTAHPQYAKAQ